MSFLNVAAHLSGAATSRPDALAIVDQHGTAWSYRQVDAECNRLAHGLQSVGINRGMRTVLMVPPSLEFFALTFALFKIGAVMVLIDPGMGMRNLGRCLSEAEPEAFIGVLKAQMARKMLGWARASVRITVGIGTRLLAQRSISSFHVAGTFATAEVTADEMAAILFTSGSTGPAKGAVYTHGIFAAQVDALRRLFQIQPGEIDLCTFPLFALFAPALGMTAVIPDMDATRPASVDPTKIFHAVKHWNCTNLFGSPALLNSISRAAEKSGTTLPSLKRVISAGAPVPAAVIERVSKMLAPGVPMYTPYGATECLPIACIDSATILSETRYETDRGRGICVGQQVPEVEVAIIPVTNEPMESWAESLRQSAKVVGEITVRGPFVSPAYFGRPDATRSAKIPDALGRIWHRTGDLGYIDDRNRIWFCGRKAHRVWAAAGPLDTIPCEAIFNQHPAVFRTALVGVGPAGRQTPVICVELESESRRLDRPQLTRELLALGAAHEHTRGIRAILYHSSFPVDVRHNAKIFREKLALWAAKRVKPV
jgi:acyl-CoA synthetase (AMP-forming)/AMP-acid ligase II